MPPGSLVCPDYARLADRPLFRRERVREFDLGASPVPHEPPVIRDGVRDGIGYAEAGPADGPALVFLHGIGGGARAFDPQLRHFGRRV